MQTEEVRLVHAQQADTWGVGDLYQLVRQDLAPTKQQLDSARWEFWHL